MFWPALHILFSWPHSKILICLWPSSCHPLCSLSPCDHQWRHHWFGTRLFAISYIQDIHGIEMHSAIAIWYGQPFMIPWLPPDKFFESIFPPEVCWRLLEGCLSHDTYGDQSQNIRGQ